MNNKETYTKHSTFIRNMYSKGYSSILISYFKFNLSLLFFPYEGTDQNGRSMYSKKGIVTTIGYEMAAGLWKAFHDILYDSLEALHLVIPCAGGTILTLEMKAPGEIFLAINKNNQTITFKFASTIAKEKVNGIEVTKIIESGLGAFMKLLDGYLTETGGSTHLNKIGDDLEAYQEFDQHEKEQQAHNAVANNSHSNNGYVSNNGYPFGNNINYQTSN